MRGGRIIIAVLLIVASLSALCSCEVDREYDEREVIESAEALLDKAKILNEIYYGKGIAWQEESGNGIYKRADGASLEKFGIFSIEELKTKTLEVFSDARCVTMFNTVLSSIKDDDVIVHYLRYYQQTDEDGTSYIMVNSKYDYHMKGSMEYLSGIRVTDVKGEIIVISVPVKLVSESGKVKNTEIEVEMIEESDGWRFASPCEAVYNESTDIYDELNKNY